MYKIFRMIFWNANLVSTGSTPLTASLRSTSAGFSSISFQSPQSRFNLFQSRFLHLPSRLFLGLRAFRLRSMTTESRSRVSCVSTPLDVRKRLRLTSAGNLLNLVSISFQSFSFSSIFPISNLKSKNPENKFCVFLQ